MGIGQRLGREAADVRASADRAQNETGAFQDLHVLGGRRERHLERRRELADGPLLPREAAEHLPACMICEGVEDIVEGFSSLLNHVVDYTGRNADSQPVG